VRATNELQATTLVLRDDRVLHAQLDDGLAMMSVERGFYYGVNPVGRWIWEWIAEERSVSSLCDRLQEQYDVDRATCEREVFDFVRALAGEGLVRLRDSSGD